MLRSIKQGTKKHLFKDTDKTSFNKKTPGQTGP